MKKLTLISALAVSLSLSACALTSAGVSPGDERNFSRTLNDESVERLIGARLKRAEAESFKDVEIEVAEGIVLLAGHVDTAEDRIEAERIAWSAPFINEVGNEIMVGDSPVGFARGTKDSVLGSSIRTRLIASSDVKARNINIEANNGVVYLLGVARTAEELERITEIASTTRGTREVVSYITVHDGQAPASTQNFAAAPQGVIPQSALPQSFPQASLPQTSLPQASVPQAALPSTQHALPGFLSETPQVDVPQTDVPKPNTAPIDPLAPYYRDALTGERIDIDPATGTIPFQPAAPTVPQAPVASAPAIPSGPTTVKLTERPTEFPSDEELGQFRIGNAGDTVSVIESAPYYIDPDTGEHIPVRYITPVGE